jgi:hypothetical protein
MKYMIYEDALTHKFAFLPLPNRFVGGDALPIVAIDRWFDSHEAAIAALPELFNRDDSDQDVRADAAAPVEAVVVPVVPSKPH